MRNLIILFAIWSVHTPLFADDFSEDQNVHQVLVVSTKTDFLSNDAAINAEELKAEKNELLEAELKEMESEYLDFEVKYSLAE